MLLNFFAFEFATLKWTIAGLYISNIKVFPGPLELVKQQNPHIFKKPTVAPGNMITRKLGFPAVINPSKH